MLTKCNGSKYFGEHIDGLFIARMMHGYSGSGIPAAAKAHHTRWRKLETTAPKPGVP